MSNEDGLRSVEVEQFRLWMIERLHSLDPVRDEQFLKDLGACMRILTTFMALQAVKMATRGVEYPGVVDFGELMKEERE